MASIGSQYGGDAFKKVMAQLSTTKPLGGGTGAVAGSAAKGQADILRSQVGLRDATIKALASTPSLKDRINSSGAGQEQPGGALGAVGNVLLNNPLTKTIIGGATFVDTGRRAIISGLNEAVDAFDSNPDTQASFKDFMTQTKDLTYGFGKAFPMKGWIGRLVGFVGDVALDPITYMSFGAAVGPGIFTRAGRRIVGLTARTAEEQAMRAALVGSRRVAGFGGKVAVAKMILADAELVAAGTADKIAADFLVRGRLALPEALFKKYGLRKPGLYMFGERVYVKGSRPVIDLISRGMVETKLGLVSWNPIERVMATFATEGVAAERSMGQIKRGLARGGVFSPEETRLYVAALTSDSAARVTSKIALDYGEKSTVRLMRDPALAGVTANVSRMLDTNEARWALDGIVPTAAERGAYKVIRTHFDDLLLKVNAAMPADMQITAIQDYLPHIVSKETVMAANGRVTQRVEDIRKYMKLDVNAPGGSFRNRGLKKGSPWFGVGADGLTEADVAGGFHRLNELAFPELGFNFFETDITQTLRQYAGHFSKQVGLGKFISSMIDHGAYKMGIETNALGHELITAAQKEFAAATAAHDVAVKSVVVNARAAVKAQTTLIDDAILAEKAVAQKVFDATGKEIKVATKAIRKLPTEAQINAANASSTKTLLTSRAELVSTWAGVRDMFKGTGPVLDALDENHAVLVKFHDDAMARIAVLDAAYTKLGPDLKIEDFLQRQGEIKDLLAASGAKVEDYYKSVGKMQAVSEDVSAAIDWALRYSNADETLQAAMESTRPKGRVGTKMQVKGVIKAIIDPESQGVAKFSDHKTKAWKLPAEGTPTFQFLARVDPGNTVKAARLSRMTSAEVSDIIVRAQSGAARVQEVREAGVWLVMHNDIVNGGVGMNPAKLENLTQLLSQAREADFVLKGGEIFAGVNEGLTATGAMLRATGMVETRIGKDGKVIVTPFKERYMAGVARQNDLAKQVDWHKARLQDFGAELDEKFISQGQPIHEAFIIRGEELVQAVADAESEVAKQVELIKDLKGKKFLDPGFTELVRAIAAPNGYRDLTARLGDAVAEYRMHSQVSSQFNVVADALADTGLVPSQSLWDGIAQRAAAPDLAAAREFAGTVDKAARTLRIIQARVNVNDQDRPGRFLFELVQLFSSKDPLMVEAAASLSEVFPEIESVVLKKIAKNTVGTTMMETAQGRFIETEVEALLGDMGIRPRIGKAGRQTVRKAGPLDMTGQTIIADRMSLKRVYTKAGEDSKPYKDLDIHMRQARNWLNERAGKKASMTPEELAQFDNAAGAYTQLFTMRRKLNSDLLVAQRELFLKDEKYRGIYVSRKRAEAAAATAQSTGVGVAASKTIAKNRAFLYQSDYGFVGALNGALRGSKSNLDAFFADFLGGAKQDFRQGATSYKILDGKLAGKSALTRAENVKNVIVNAETGLPETYKSSIKTITVLPHESFVGVLEKRTQDRLTALGHVAESGGQFPPGALQQGLPGNQGGFIYPNQGMQAPAPVVRGEGSGIVSPSISQGPQSIKTQAPASVGPKPSTVRPIYQPGEWVYAQDLSGIDGYSQGLTERLKGLEVARAEHNALTKKLAHTTVKLDTGIYGIRQDAHIARLKVAIIDAGKAEGAGPDVDKALATLNHVSRKRSSLMDRDLALLQEKLDDGSFAATHRNRIQNLKAKQSRLNLEIMGLDPADRAKSATATELRKTERELRVASEAMSTQYATEVDAIKAKHAGPGAEEARQKARRSARRTLKAAKNKAREVEVAALKKELADVEAQSVASMYGEDIAKLQEKIHNLGLTGMTESTATQIRTTAATLGLDIKTPIVGASLDEVIATGKKTAQAASRLGGRVKAEPFVHIVGTESDQLSKEFVGIGNKVTSLIDRGGAISDELIRLRGMTDAEMIATVGASHAQYRTQIGLMRQLAEVRKTLSDDIATKNGLQRLELAGLTVKEANLRRKLQAIGKLPKSASEELMALHAKFVGAVAEFDGARLLHGSAEEMQVTARVQIQELTALRDIVAAAKVASAAAKTARDTRVAELSGLRGRVVTAGKNIPKIADANPAELAWAKEVENLVQELSNLNVLAKSPTVEKNYIKVQAALISSHAQMLMAPTARLSAAQQELLGLRGLEALAKRGGIAQAIPGYTDIVREHDIGFVQLSEKYYPDLGVRKEIATLMQNMHRFAEPETAREMKEFLGRYTRFYKTNATLSPGFHLRNGISNGFMLFAAGAHPLNLMEGLKISKSWARANQEGLDYAQWLARDIAPLGADVLHNTEQAFAGMVGSGGGMTSDYFRELAPVHNQAGKMTDNRVTRGSRRFGSTIEAHSRFMLSYDGAMAGLSTDHIIARTQRFLIDYEDVSKGDKIMRQIIPFWMWTSRNFPMQIQNIWMNPRAYSIYGSLKRNISDPSGETEMPPWMKEAGNFKLPFGSNLYATPDIGFNRLQQQVGDFQNPSRMMSQVNPLLRVPMELLGGKQFFGGRRFSDKPLEVSGGVGGVVQPILQALGYGQTGPTGKKFVDEQALYAFMSLNPLASKAEQLLPSTQYGKQRGTGNAIKSFLGIPIKELTPTAVAAENNRRVRMIQALVKEKLALQPTG